MKYYKPGNLTLTLLVILLTLSSVFIIYFSYSPVYAHTTKKIGNIEVETGWSTEPPLSNQVNEIFIKVDEVNSQTFVPVRNALKDINIKIYFGGLSKTLRFVPSEIAGKYLVDIIPAETGSYYLLLDGFIKDASFTSIKMDLQDVEDERKILFPDISEDSNTNNNDNIQFSNLQNSLKPIIRNVTKQVQDNENSVSSLRESFQEISSIFESFQYTLDKIGLIGFIGLALGGSAIVLTLLRNYR